MADATQAANTQNQAFKDLTATSAGLSKQFGIVERMQSRMKVAFLDTAVGSFVVYGKALMDMSRAVSGLYEEETDRNKAVENMTIAQKAAYKMALQFTPVLKMLGDRHSFMASQLDENNEEYVRWQMLLIRGSTYAAFLAIGLLALAAGFVATDLALNGSNASTLEATENYGNLHNALTGVATILTGEGGAGAWQLFTGSMLMGGVVAMIFGAKAGIVVGIMAMVTSAFRLGQEHLGGLTGGLMAAVPVFMGIMGTIALTTTKLAGLKKVITFVKLAFGTTAAGALAGMALIAGGVIGLFAIATGKVEEGKEAIVYAFTGIAIAVGAILLGMAAIPAAALALVLLFIADTYNLLTSGLDNFTETWSDRWTRLTDWFSNLWSTYVTDPINNSMESMSESVTKMTDNLKFAWGIVKTLFFDKFSDEITYLKMAWNAMLGNETLNAIMDAAWNTFVAFANPAISLYNAIPGVDNIDKLEKRAAGGPVTGGQPYLVGEKGPEIFTPGSSGNIIPNDQIGGGQNITLNINVGGVTDRTDKRALAREIGDMLTQELRRTGGAPTRGRF